MEFNLSARGRASEVKAQLKKQADVIRKDSGEIAGDCAASVVEGLGKFADDQEPGEAISVSVTVRGFTL